MTSLEIVDERTNKNTENITKIFKCLFGNGSGGGMVSEMKELKTNLIWIKGLLFIVTSSSIGVFIKIIFFSQ